MNARESLGLYLHVPFCATRCAYCNFAIVAHQDGRMPELVDALVRELAARATSAPPIVESVHFGGGTPSRLPATAIDRLIEAVRDLFPLAPGAEIGLEANPEDVTPDNAAAWRAGGVTRLTVGVQTFVPEGLAALGRPGAPAWAERALAAAREHGPASLGVDLIFGWPGQTRRQWEDDLDRLEQRPPDHLSLYALETDARTPLVRSIERGERPEPDPDLAADLYERAAARLPAVGLQRYEISNWARDGHRSRHNLRYWTDLPYLGVGPSASSYVAGRRWTNPRRLGDYLAAARAGFPAPEAEAYDADRRTGEALVFGLRLDEGVDLDRVRARHGAEGLAARARVLEQALRDGLLEREGARLRLSERARLIADELFVDLL
jgi:oxygen-independent coproporphyrinogen-3 oxidase